MDGVDLASHEIKIASINTAINCACCQRVSNFVKNCNATINQMLEFEMTTSSSRPGEISAEEDQKEEAL